MGRPTGGALPLSAHHRIGAVLATVTTCAILGLEGRLVEVQVDIARQGLPTFLIVGLPDDAVREARERVRTAIRNSGLVFPNRRRNRCCG